MKIKADFITNSSSTNFILSSKIALPDKINISMPVNLKKLIDQVIRTKEELNRYIDDGYYISEDVDKMFQAIENGETLYVLTASSDNGPLESFLCDEGIEGIDFPDGIKVIYGEGGY